jgi:hypothetical protein
MGGPPQRIPSARIQGGFDKNPIQNFPQRHTLEAEWNAVALNDKAARKESPQRFSGIETQSGEHFSPFS